MLLAMMLMLAGQDVDLAAGIQNTRDVINPPCAKPRDGSEIVVCARREADKYRVPLVLSANANNSVPLRTATLTRDYNRLPCGQSAFTAQCGSMFGVSVSTNGQNIQLVRRELAP